MSAIDSKTKQVITKDSGEYIVKACGFCGGEASLNEWQWQCEDVSTPRYYVACTHCAVSPRTSDYNTPEEAIDVWNQRPRDKEIIKEISNRRKKRIAKNLKQGAINIVKFFKDCWGSQTTHRKENQICESCGGEISGKYDYLYCPHCGERLKQIVEEPVIEKAKIEYTPKVKAWDKFKY